jgi:hypothetical protein
MKIETIIVKLIELLIGIALVVFPEPSTTAAGLALILDAFNIIHLKNILK